MSTTDRESRATLSVVALGALVFAACGRAPTPPSPDVVATYTGGQITVEQVRRLVQGELKGLRVLVGDKLEPVSIHSSISHSSMLVPLEVDGGLGRDLQTASPAW